MAMQTKTKIFILVGVIVVFFSFLIFGSYTSYYDTQATLKTQIEKKQTVCKLYYTKMIQIFKDKTQVTRSYKTDVTEFAKELMEGRYDKGDGSLMKWIQEQNPKFDESMYKDLMNTIQSEREGFFVQQEQLLDMKREHDNLFDKFWSGMYMKWIGAKKIDVVVLENPESKQAYKTGIEVETSNMFDTNK
jgi:hypothetical protein